MSVSLLITRPRHQARALARRAQQEGWRAISLPLFTIEAVCSDEERKAQLEAAADADWWIFTSTNAVSLSEAAAPERWARTAAIGAATATALETAGHPPAAVPEHRFSTEALLSLPEFSAVDGQRVVIIGNEAPRETLRDMLAARGARVDSLPVYRLEAIDHSSEMVGTQVADADIAILTSVSAADRLWSLSDAPTRRRLAEMPLVVPSERVADFCRARGMHGPHAVAQPMSNAALLAAADTLPTMPKNEHDTETGAQENADAAAATNAEPAAGSATEAHPEASAPADPAPASEPDAAGTPPAPPAAPAASARRRGGGWWIVLVILLLLAAGAAAGWWGWQQLQRIESATVQRVDRLQQSLADQKDALDAARQRASAAAQQAGSLSDDIAALTEQSEAQASKLREIEGIVDAGRTQAHLVAVEQLLLGANERLQLGGDIDGARRALGLADQRLAALNDPRFFAVRETIAEERSALRAVQKVDRAALALQLSALIKRSDALRLRGGVPDTTAPALPDEATTDSALPAWERVLRSVGDALSSVFVVRRTDVPVKPLMAPEQDGLVRSVLLLRLETARAALMAGEQASYEAALEDARRWLDAQYASEDAAVQAAMQELKDLQGEVLRVDLPDITRSLTRLRAVTASVRGAS